ncbi:MAG: hypothetical protein ACYTG0_13310 [Planctomycetota bacterium]|jgi:hypothetical protein
MLDRFKGEVAAALTAICMVAGVAPTTAAHVAAEPPDTTAAIEVPVVVGPWWQIAPNAPDVGKWATGKENACDFTIFQSADGRWHLIACVRGTSHYGDRLFHHWETESLTDADWTPRGILDVPRGTRGSPPQIASVQAPHAFLHDGTYYLFYNSGPAHAMISRNGRDWQPHQNVEGERVFFEMGRDVCLFRDRARNRWIAYYCGTVERQGKPQGAMVARTAPALEGPWSEDEIPVRTEGNPESPFVVERGDRYYLFQQMSVFCSDDPVDFDRPQITHMTGIWYNGKWAPEIIEHKGRFFMAGYGRGIHMARFVWERKTPDEIRAWRETELARILAERRAADERRKRREQQQRERQAAPP